MKHIYIVKSIYDEGWILGVYSSPELADEAIAGYFTASSDMENRFVTLDFLLDE